MTWPKPMPIVEVEWTDSSTMSGWQEVGDAIKSLGANTISCRSSGYLLHKDRKRVTIIQNASEQGHIDMIMDIPKVAIKSITVLKKAVKWSNG